MLIYVVGDSGIFIHKPIAIHVALRPRLMAFEASGHRAIWVIFKRGTLGC